MVSQLKHTLTWLSAHRSFVAVVCVGLLVMYGFYRVSVRLMRFFFNVSDKQIFEMGFAIGALFAAVLSIGLWWALRRFTVRTDMVYAAAVKELRKHESVDKALGGIWRPGGFQGFAVESFEDALKGSERRQRSSFLEAPSQRVQMIFPLKGLEDEAMVSLEAYKRHGDIIFEMLSVKVYGSKEHLYLIGEENHQLFSEVAEVLDGAMKHAEQKTKARQ